MPAKKRGDRSAIEPIVNGGGVFEVWQLKVDATVPVPPSNTARKNQGVIELATAISERTGIPICASCISKVKSTAQLKGVFERTKRDEILAGVFLFDSGNNRGQASAGVR
jgi:predicted amidophosphoribosyltransferase